MKWALLTSTDINYFFLNISENPYLYNTAFLVSDQPSVLQSSPSRFQIPWNNSEEFELSKLSNLFFHIHIYIYIIYYILYIIYYILYIIYISYIYIFPIYCPYIFPIDWNRRSPRRCLSWRTTRWNSPRNWTRSATSWRRCGPWKTAAWRLGRDEVGGRKRWWRWGQNTG